MIDKVPLPATVGALLLAAARFAFAAPPAANFDQGVDVKEVIACAREEVRFSRLSELLGRAGAVDEKKQPPAYAATGMWNRCQMMGLENNQCVYMCRDGRKILMPLPPGLERMGSRACLQYMDAPPLPPAEKPKKGIKALTAGDGEQAAACEQKCDSGYRARIDLCYQLHDNPVGLRPCLQDTYLGYAVCMRSCKEPGS